MHDQVIPFKLLVPMVADISSRKVSGTNVACTMSILTS